MTKIYSINSDVKFPDMEHYDMGKASDMALYLAHCDFYPFRPLINDFLRKMAKFRHQENIVVQLSRQKSKLFIMN